MQPQQSSAGPRRIPTMVPSGDTPVIGVHFPIFLQWLQTVWTPGTHFALCGPTGEGKTTFAVSILNLRKWVLALDPKGEDDTLTASGFTRVTKLPLSSRMRNDIADGKPARLIIGGAARTNQEEKALRELMNKAIAMARQQGGWTLYADEFQILADLRMFNLGKPIEQLLIAARKNRTSVVTSFQAPAWVPKASTRQAGLVAIWPTRDINMIKAVAESMGRPWQNMAQAVYALEKYYVLIIPSDVHAPMIITKPPKVF